jgi:single-stranded DNA-binding protein
MDYQKFILVGNTTNDARIQKSKKGDMSFATFSVGAKNSKDRTSFFPVVVFGKLGESLVSYVTKGRKVLIEGHIEVSTVGRFNVVAERVILGALPKAPEPVKKTETTK